MTVSSSSSSSTASAAAVTRPKARISIATYFFAVLLAFSLVTMLQNRSFHQTTTTTGNSSIWSSLSANHHANALRESFLQRRYNSQQQTLVVGHSAAADPDESVVDPERNDDSSHQPNQLAGLSCDRYGGPPDAHEMIYWHDIPDDSRHMSPLHRNHPLQQQQQADNRAMEEEDSSVMIEYLTFEPDRGGFNNIRMAMETVIGLAFAMGRTLVLPPQQEFYLLGKNKGKDRTHFSFNHFFNMQAIHEEHAGLDIIRMDQFLETAGLGGYFRDTTTGQVSFPPGNRTQYDGAPADEIRALFAWLRSVAYVAIWSPEKCLAAFPALPHEENVQQLLAMEKEIQANPPSFEDYVGKPVPVNAPAIDRMKENWAGREKLCIYNEEMQASRLVHFPNDSKIATRLLVHFYAFLFFQDWKQNLWMMRFVRDHVRYVDEIQCAAARIVRAARERARQRDPKNNAAGEFDSFHVRRGDFQYIKTRVEASEILRQARKKIADQSTVYIATDERDKSFFKPMQDHYDVVFLDDFKDELGGINSNYYGMIDQLVASRGRVFFGCWFSTFTGYILRLRGYHADKEKAPGYENGVTNSWFYVLPDRFDHMQKYQPVKQSFYAREFPTSWRLIDTTTGAP